MRDKHGFESSGLVGVAEEGDVRKGVGVSQRVVVGHDDGARMGDKNGEVPAFWSSATFASEAFNCIESFKYDTLVHSFSLTILLSRALSHVAKYLRD